VSRPAKAGAKAGISTANRFLVATIAPRHTAAPNRRTTLPGTRDRSVAARAAKKAPDTSGNGDAE
jgi:hypothetical protein